MASTPLIILAGATGHLGRRIAHHLRVRGASVRALVRTGFDPFVIGELKHKGVTVVIVDYNDTGALAALCAGGHCLVSALSGLEDTIVGTQTQLLQAALAAQVPRFIPSDYCIDYNPLPGGRNRNLDLRRRFADRLNAAPIKATGILNGMFTDLLTGPAPVILDRFHRVLYWGSATQQLDFTTMENTAEFTAAAALDPDAPRYLRIAGEVATAQDLARDAAAAKGHPFKLFRAGSLGTLRALIAVTRRLAPQKTEVFPAWQGMQYLHDMFEGRVKLGPLDNGRYPGVRWTGVTDVLRKAGA
ncbi:NmrA family protein [Flaviaesturariibacter flavus]|uniref:NmrA family protein n=2 Tax=Flaviaesturariibacter flavus TaxID=2502780 RepID=A0A4R1BC50_9BACT|nr:NmrA family protein [Flaviaesturariibacter flavus]